MKSTYNFLKRANTEGEFRFGAKRATLAKGCEDDAVPDKVVTADGRAIVVPASVQARISRRAGRRY